MYIYFSPLSTIRDAFYGLERLHWGMMVRRYDGDGMELDTPYLPQIQLGTFFDLLFQYILAAVSWVVSCGNILDSSVQDRGRGRAPVCARVVCIILRLGRL